MLGKNDSNNWTAFIEHLLYGVTAGSLYALYVRFPAMLWDQYY